MYDYVWQLCVFRACDGHCPYGELLLLIAIHVKEKQLDQIEELIAETLNMKVSVSVLHLYDRVHWTFMYWYKHVFTIVLFE